MSKKFAVFFILPLFAAGFLRSQSLLELSKMEKERRESLKDRKSILLTNSTLKDFKKKDAAVSFSGTPAPAPAPGDPTEESQETAPAETPPLSPAARVRTAQPAESRAALEERLRQVLEYVELLTLKMNALWQEFYSMDDMTSKDSIQRQISDTYEKLQLAQQDEARLRKELENRR